LSDLNYAHFIVKGGKTAPGTCLVGGHLAVGLDAMLQAVELPARVANLAAGLANVDRNALPLKKSVQNYKNHSL
jgi:hypothetical protein